MSSAEVTLIMMVCLILQIIVRQLLIPAKQIAIVMGWGMYVIIVQTDLILTITQNIFRTFRLRKGPQTGRKVMNSYKQNHLPRRRTHE